MKSKKGGRRAHSRPDWEHVKVDVMRFCLRAKLEQHFGEFYNLLKSACGRMIVERSRNDPYWGAIPGALPFRWTAQRLYFPTRGRSRLNVSGKRSRPNMSLGWQFCSPQGIV